MVTKSPAFHTASIILGLGYSLSTGSAAVLLAFTLVCSMYLYYMRPYFYFSDYITCAIISSAYLLLFLFKPCLLQRQEPYRLISEQYFLNYWHWGFCTSIVNGLSCAPKALLFKFKEISLIHLLCVSGLHINLIHSAAKKMLSFLFKERPSKIIATILSGTFVVINGLAYPSVRAFYMIANRTANEILLSQYYSANSLGVITVFWLILFPMECTRAGVLYSFLITSILLTVYPYTIQKASFVKLDFISESLIFQLCCLMGHIPISLIAGNKISLMSIVYNISHAPIFLFLSASGIVLSLTLFRIPCLYKLKILHFNACRTFFYSIQSDGSYSICKKHILIGSILFILILFFCTFIETYSQKIRKVCVKK